MVIVLGLGLFSPVSTAAPTLPGNLHPYLAALAVEQPETLVGVIVQTTTDTALPEARVSELGGEVTAELGIIHGFAATLPASQTPELARTYGVRVVSFDAPVTRTDCGDCTTTGQLANTFVQSIRANEVWGQLQGQGIGIAVVDSGVTDQMDLTAPTGETRVVADVAFNAAGDPSTLDAYGHGSHVAGIIAGNGRSSDGAYMGVAPLANIINVKVSNDRNPGTGSAVSVIQALQWILENKATYNIRVVNLSLNSAVPESYKTSPIDAAVEVLWFNGIVIVASSGNSGHGADFAPANDPFVITVGAVDDRGTASIADDAVASFSTYGNTGAGYKKPDLVAPGRNIVSLMGSADARLAAEHPANAVGGPYFRMSGTSMAAPMVSGAIALLLQDEPNLTPDQVKYRLMATANTSWSDYKKKTSGAGYLDVAAAIAGTTTQSANTGTPASQLLWSGAKAVNWTSVNWNSVNWNSVNWNSVNWNSVNWNSVNWNSVNWNSTYWGP